MTYTIVKYTPLMPLLPAEQLEAVVTAFYDRVYAHPWIGRFFTTVDQKIQEFNLVHFIQMSWEDKAYPKRQARTLWHQHAHMLIGDELFDLRQELFAAALRHHGHGQDVVETFLDFNERWRTVVVKSSIEECSDMLAELVVHSRPGSGQEIE